MKPVIPSELFAANPPPQFRELSKLPGVRIDLRYAGTNNFMGRDVYGGFDKAYLHEIAFTMLEAALAELRRESPGHELLIFDALRPRRAQRILFDHVRGTPQEPYVADPELGSLHNFGFAVDLTLVDPSGRELDMGTPFDDFEELAQPQAEEKYLASGRLGRAQYENRLRLRRPMESAGFKVLKHEWWHFNALPVDEARKSHSIVD